MRGTASKGAGPGDLDLTVLDLKVQVVEPDALMKMPSALCKDHIVWPAALWTFPRVLGRLRTGRKGNEGGEGNNHCATAS